jgi:hypothetical protein
MDAIILLANAVNTEVGGDLNALGLGWEVIGPPPLPQFNILIIIKLSQEFEGDSVGVRLRLVDGAGEPAGPMDGDMVRPLELHQTINHRPPFKTPEGLYGGINMSVTVPSGLAIGPGLYEWILSLDEVPDLEWRRRFYVRAKPDEFPPVHLTHQPS